jgi:hypothetical protein
MTGIKPFAMGIAAMVAMGAVAFAQTDEWEIERLRGGRSCGRR